MSFRSLLQLASLVLIFLIIGGIYYLYFYSSPKEKNILNNLNKENPSKINNEDESILEDVIEKEDKLIAEENKIKNEDNLNIQTLNKDSTNININNADKNKANYSQQEYENNISNLTKEIEYITTNKSGDVFKIFAKYGKTNIENSNILDLVKVNGVISSSKRSEIYITSDNAEYNYDNQNSKFYNNVEIKYDDKVINCDNFDLNVNKNYAIAYNNVKIKDNRSIMKAQIVTLNTITKDIKINSQEKIKIFTN
tara:strand:+ start:268 stop:1026 length:759 start_codon:yes stop_codon:yes gene_type:complete